MCRAQRTDDDGWAGRTARGPRAGSRRRVHRRARPDRGARLGRVHRMIPFLDLRAQYETIKDDVHQAINRVLESGQFILGDEVAAFESEFAAYVGAAHGVAVNSGTSALHLALLAAAVGPGDEVITAPFPLGPTVAADRYPGAPPVFVAIGPPSFN